MQGARVGVLFLLILGLGYLLFNNNSLCRDNKPDRRRISKCACFIFDDDGYVSMNSVHGVYSGILDLAHLRRHRWNDRSDKQLPVGHRAAKNADVGDQGTALSHDHVNHREDLHVSDKYSFISNSRT